MGGLEMVEPIYFIGDHMVHLRRAKGFGGEYFDRCVTQRERRSLIASSSKEPGDGEQLDNSILLLWDPHCHSSYEPATPM